MSTVTTSLGSFPDTADILADNLDVISPTFLSNITMSTSGSYISGGYDSLGNAYTTRPLMVTKVLTQIGKNGSSNVGVRTTFASSTKTGFVPSTLTYYTGNFSSNTTVNISSQTTYKAKAFAGDEYFYGFYAVLNFSGTFLYAQGGSTGDVYQGLLTRSSTKKLSGQVTYDSIPSAVTGLTVSSPATDTTVSISWTAPADDGGASCSIKGYRINGRFISGNETYASLQSKPWTVLVANTGSSTTTRQLTGLVPDAIYQIQVAALNEVTDLHNNSNYDSITAHVGVRSATLEITTQQSTHNLRVFANGTYKKATIKIWDGSQWIGYPNIDIKVWNGTQFKDSALEL